eukprot:2851184-Pleurochrysis_carterae.AAC.3
MMHGGNIMLLSILEYHHTRDIYLQQHATTITNSGIVLLLYELCSKSSVKDEVTSLQRKEYLEFLRKTTTTRIHNLKQKAGTLNTAFNAVIETGVANFDEKHAA